MAWKTLTVQWAKDIHTAAPSPKAIRSPESSKLYEHIFEERPSVSTLEVHKTHRTSKQEAAGSTEDHHPAQHWNRDELSPYQKAARENTTLTTMGTHNQMNLFNLFDIIILKLDCFLNSFKLW